MRLTVAVGSISTHLTSPSSSLTLSLVPPLTHIRTHTSHPTPPHPTPPHPTPPHPTPPHPTQAGQTIEISDEYVKMRVGDLLKVGDLRKYIL